MRTTDLHGVGPVLAQRLDIAGLVTVEAVAGATIDQLTKVPGVGPHVAARLQTEARARVGESSLAEHRPARPAKVAKSVERLRRDIPDLARSKKQARRLTKAAQRLSGWVDDLGRSGVRNQFMAEVTKIGDDAKKRTGSKKGARALREHATRIEAAVRKVG